MADAANATALLALFFGLYYLAAGLGGLYNPGAWERMVDEMGGSAYGQFLGAVVAMLIGFALIALVPPRGDWLNLVVFAIGCLATCEGVVFMIVPGKMLSLFRPTLRRAARPFAVFAVVAGLFFCWAGLARL